MSMSKEQMKILLKAQRGERDAVWMYKRLSRKVRSIDDKLAFIRLARDEARHEDVFRKLTGREVKASPAKAILVPLMYRILGKDKTYSIIADAEYKAAGQYSHIIDAYPEVIPVMNDETHHGDAVMGLLKKN